MSATFALPILDAAPVRPDYARGPRSLDAVKLLRLSITDRCNLRCVYCMPEDGVDFRKQSDLLSADEIIAVARAAASVGVTHFKITGGEPTVRSDLLDIVRGLAALKPVDLSLTTNGMMLDRLAKPLRDAGLHRITVSWDSMRADRFDRIARGGSQGMGGLERLLAGLGAAVSAGFDRLKINTVVIGGVNDDEVVDFARLTLDRPWTVRFIEYMPLGDSTLTSDALGPDHFTVDNEIVKARIAAALGELVPVPRENEAGVGPANVFYIAPALAGGGAQARLTGGQEAGCHGLQAVPSDADRHGLKTVAPDVSAPTHIAPGLPGVDNATSGDKRLPVGGRLPALTPAKAGAMCAPHTRGRVGFISAMSKPFCETCNRLRLTASGELRSCLFDGGEVNALPALRPAPDSAAIVELMRRCVALKPETHSHRGNRAMSQMGG